MTAQDLYDLLDKAKVEFEIVEIFDGLRTLNFMVDEDEENEECEDEENEE
jgi:hypothetical protein